jgi:endonuclease G
LTVRQWVSLLAIIIAVVVFGCRFCYNVVRDRIPSPNQNQTEQTNENRPVNRQQAPRSSEPASSLSEAQAAEIYLKLGNPSDANQSEANDYLMINPYFALSYNRSRATANWVSWRVTSADLGNVERANDFRPDNRLPPGWVRVTPADYTRSGFDRGHLVPSADRANTPEANSATFLMTNIVPQTPDSNQGVWKSLEDYTRDLVRQGNEVYITAGVMGERGSLKNKVTIPANLWKVVVVLPAGTEDVSQITPQTRVIAVNMPNLQGVRNDDWRKYRVTVRNIEQNTGYNLFSNLPQNVQDAIETRMDSQ